MTKNRTIAFRILFFLYLAAVLFLCFGKFDDTPSVELSLWGLPMDKLVHFAMFFPFPILVFFAFEGYGKGVKSTLGVIGLAFAAGLVLALATEIGQACLTDYRSGDSMDFLADATSLLVSSALVAAVSLRKLSTTPCQASRK